MAKGSLSHMDEEHRLTVPGVLEEVTRVCTFVVEAAEAAGLDERAIYHCQMAVDEWCTNVIEHGFSQNPDKTGRIEVDLRIEPGQLVITITDDAPRFDPMLLSEPRTDQPLNDREPGGLGWFLIKKVMDDVQYDYADNHNRLQMVKRIAAGTYPMRANALNFPSYELRGGIWVVTPSGRLDANGGPLLETTLSTHLNANHVYLVVDMTGVTYISSGGLKVLLGAQKKARLRGGGLALTGLTPRVLEVFQISGFEVVFRIAATIQAAAAGFPPAGQARLEL